MVRHVEIPKEWRGPLFHRGNRKLGGSRAHGFPSLSCDCLSLAEFLVRQEEGVDLLPVGLCYCGRVGKVCLYLTNVLFINFYTLIIFCIRCYERNWMNLINHLKLTRQVIFYFTSAVYVFYKMWFNSCSLIVTQLKVIMSKKITDVRRGKGCEKVID